MSNHETSKALKTCFGQALCKLLAMGMLLLIMPDESTKEGNKFMRICNCRG